jgi:hypothetical protein
MVLGLDDSEAYDNYFKSMANRDFSRCEICLLRPPILEDEETGQRWNDLQYRFSQASFKGLFVPKSTANPHRLSYVDIVKHNSPKASTNQKDDSTSIVPRKVSNASTVSTQADEEWFVESKESESTPSGRIPKSVYPDDITSVNSEFSELACTTQQRKIRIENRKKEIQAKKVDIGLLAIVPCPLDEPDRSKVSPFFF